MQSGKSSLLTSKGRCDFVLLAVVVALVCIGLLFVYSASYYSAQVHYGDKFYFLKKQLVGAVVGAVVMTVLAVIDLRFVRKFWIVGVVICVVLLSLVFVPHIGIENYGAKRWIGFGGFSLQPSELAKFALVLFSAEYMAKTDMKQFRNILPVILVGGVFCALIITEPNMSITVCMAIVMVVLLFVGGASLKHLCLLGIPLVMAVPLLIIAEPYRFQRLLAFIDPWASPKGEGYQLIQSLYALGSGGFFGVGIFHSRQKYLFLPFAESDFVFSVIGEETGLFGATVLFLLYSVLIVRGIKTAMQSPSKFNCFLSAGITSVVAVQSLVNFAVVTGSIPPTGLPLPFVSYGGTSLVVFMSAMGLLLNLSKQAHNNLEAKWIT